MIITNDITGDKKTIQFLKLLQHYSLMILTSIAIGLYVGLNRELKKTIDTIFLEICATIKLYKFSSDDSLDSDFLQDLKQLDNEFKQSIYLKGTNDIKIISFYKLSKMGLTIKVDQPTLKYMLYCTSKVLQIQETSKLSKNISKSSYIKTLSIFKIRGGNLKTIAYNGLLELWPKQIPLTKLNILKTIVATFGFYLIMYGSAKLVTQFGVITPDQLINFYQSIGMNGQGGILGNTKFILSILADPIKYHEFLNMIGFDTNRLGLFVLAIYGDYPLLNPKLINLFLAFLMSLSSVGFVLLISKLSFYPIIGTFLLKIILISELIFVDFPYILIWITRRLIELISVILGTVDKFTDLPKDKPAIWAAYQNFVNLIKSGNYSFEEAVEILRRDLEHIRITGSYPHGYSSNIISSSPSRSVPLKTNTQPRSLLMPSGSEVVGTQVKAKIATSNFPLIKE